MSGWHTSDGQWVHRTREALSRSSGSWMELSNMSNPFAIVADASRSVPLRLVRGEVRYQCGRRVQILLPDPRCREASASAL